MIIGLIGQKRVGKDTVAAMLKDINHDFKTFALAEPIKDIARIMFNFTEKQLYDDEKDMVDPRWGIKPRDFFEQFGTEIMQFDIYKYLPNLEKNIPQRLFWVKSLMNKIGNDKDIIITDVRGLHELKEIKKKGAIFIKIVKPNKQCNDSSSSSNSNNTMHITQQEANEIGDEFVFDKIINDGSLTDLNNKVVNVWKRIKLYYN
jgi:hypothetical protein